LFLVGLKIAGHGPKHVAKYNLIAIIASCLDVSYVLTVHYILHKFDNTQGMASLKFFGVGVVVDTGHPLLAGGNEPWNDELNLSNGLS